MKFLTALLIVLLAGCSGGGSSGTPSNDDPTGVNETSNTDETDDTNASNPNLPVVQDTFDSLIASNSNVERVIESCRSTYNEFNNSFLAQDSNALQTATEIKVTDGDQLVDAIQVQWIFINQPVVTTQNTAIEANSAGGVFLLRDGACGVNVFQGFGLNQAQNDTLQKISNPSTAVLACVDEIPASATTVQKFPLYEIAGNSYGLYRHDYIDTTETERITYSQVYETGFNGTDYFVACPAPEVLAREQLILRTSTRVTFDITVPAYMSSALQVRVEWGEKDFTAMWNSGELWTASDDFPVNMENPLTVTFSDRNGTFTLGTFERNFRTGVNESQTYQITADQFNTDSFDGDGDGVSNINEVYTTFSTIQSNVFGPSCNRCHSFPYSRLLNQNSSRILVVPYEPDNSYLWQKMTGAPGFRGSIMDYAGDAGAQLVRDWIEGGALDN